MATRPRPRLPVAQESRAPRTVLFLHPSAGGYGADRQLHVLATGLDPSRYQPLVVLPEAGELGPRLTSAGVEVVVSDLAVLRRGLLRGRTLRKTLGLARRNASELGELARRREVAVVHSNSTIVLAGQSVADRAGRPHLMHVREIYEGAAGKIGSALWLPFRQRIVRADALACVSEAARAPFAHAKHAFVLRDALARELALPSRDMARRALGIDAGSFVVAVVGRISDWKGQEVLVRALHEPQLRGLDIVVLFAGDSAPDQRHFTERLTTVARELGVEDRIRLLGFREDVDTLLAAADTVAHPSTHPDALPNTLIEAAAASLPVVATSTGGQGEIVRTEVTGLLVPPGDSRALATALRRLADDRGLAGRLGAAAATDARRRFGRDTLVDELQAAYDRLCEASRPVAWLLPSKRLSVSQQAAPDVRLARFESSFRDLGYRLVIFSPQGLRSAPKLVLQALRERPGLIFTNTAIHGPALAAIKRLLGERVSVVVDVMGLHSLEVEQAYPVDWVRPLVSRIWVALEGMACRAADFVLTVNHRHSSLVRRRYRPDGVHTLRDAAEPELAALAPLERAALGMPADAIVVGYVGSLVYSRLDSLFEAFAKIAAGDRLRLLIIGDGPDLERHRREAEAIGKYGRNVFLGALPRERAHAALRSCDIAYSDCWSEAGFPFKLFEYMSLGLPIVTVGKPQTREVLEDGRDALFYGTESELADRLQRLARDPELRARLGAEARRTLLSGHTIDHRAHELGSILRGEQAKPRPARQPPEMVSVILAVLNGERYVREQLAALAAQTYASAWELVVVDNGCTDRTMDIVESWRMRLPSLTVVDARDRRGVNYARRLGVEAARGELLAFCDVDDVARPTWLEKLVEASAHADIVGGNRDDEALNSEIVRAWRPRTPRVALPVKDAFLPIVDGGNCVMWADVARDVGWDESFIHGGTDVEVSWRAQLAGYTVGFAPDAVMQIRYREGLPTMVRQYFSYGKAAPLRFRRFHRSGMPRSRLRDALRSWWWLLRHAPDLAGPIEPRGNWLRRAALDAGRILGSLRWRVLYLGPPPPPSGPHLVEFGVRWPPETFITRKLERLVAAGFRVTVAAPLDSPEGRTEPVGVERLPILRDGGHPVRGTARAALAALRLLLRSPRRMAIVARAARMPTAADRAVNLGEAIHRFGAYARIAVLEPNLIHFEWATSAAHFLSLVDAVGCPYVVSCHGGETQIHARTPAGSATARAFPEIYRRAAAVHSVAEAVTADAARFGLDREKTWLIRAGVDPGFFRPAETPHHANGTFPILAVGTLRWLKGFEYALLAVAELARQGVPVSLDIVGGDPEWDEPSERERLHATISALGLESRVRVHGRVYPREVRDRLQSAGAYLQSSLGEGHPTAVVEAMSCGVPVVATDCGGTREALTHGIEGFLVAPRDWRAAAAALRSLWVDPDLRTAMGKAGRARVEAEFTIDRQSERFLRFYEHVVERCS